MLVVAAYFAPSLADLLRHWEGRIPLPLQELIAAIVGGIVRWMTGR